ncbi:MAG TPA: NTPase [Firmicutes bacterium]|nr:NTPase [Bacillota bacterium]
MKILLTGLPGIGKTTVIQKVTSRLRDRVGGFITREQREGGRRTGFVIETLDGKRAILAVRSSKGKPRVGRYRVIVENIESVAVRALENAWHAGKIVVVDEIGKMELASNRFKNLIETIIESDTMILGTLSVARDPLLEAIRRREDIELIEVTMQNRESLPDRIVKILGTTTGGS